MNEPAPAAAPDPAAVPLRRKALWLLLFAAVGTGALHHAGVTHQLFPPELTLVEQEQRAEALRLRERLEEQEWYLERRRALGQTLMQRFVNGTEIQADRRHGDRAFRRHDYQAAVERYTRVEEAYDRVMDPFVAPPEVRPARNASREARERWFALRRAHDVPSVAAAEDAAELYASAALLWRDREAQQDAWLQAAALWDEASAEAEARLAPLRAGRDAVRERMGERFDAVAEEMSSLNRELARPLSRVDDRERRRRMALHAERAELRAERAGWGLHPDDSRAERARAMDDFMAAGELAAELDDLEAMVTFLGRRLEIAGR